MKILKYRILIGVITFTVCYLIGCFCNASFNIVEWHPINRFMVGIFGGFLSIVFATCPLYNTKN